MGRCRWPAMHKSAEVALLPGAVHWVCSALVPRQASHEAQEHVQIVSREKEASVGRDESTCFRP